KDLQLHRPFAIEQDPLDLQWSIQRQHRGIDRIQYEELVLTGLKKPLAANFRNLAASADLKLRDAHFERLQDFAYCAGIELGVRFVYEHDCFIFEADLHVIYTREAAEIDL